jgi:hypothetical protein
MRRAGNDGRPKTMTEGHARFDSPARREIHFRGGDFVTFVVVGPRSLRPRTDLPLGAMVKGLPDPNRARPTAPAKARRQTRLR